MVLRVARGWELRKTVYGSSGPLLGLGSAHASSACVAPMSVTLSRKGAGAAAKVVRDKMAEVSRQPATVQSSAVKLRAVKGAMPVTRARVEVETTACIEAVGKMVNRKTCAACRGSARTAERATLVAVMAVACKLTEVNGRGMVVAAMLVDAVQPACVHANSCKV